MTTKQWIGAYTRAIVLVGLGIGISFVVSWRDDVIAPAVVDFADHHFVRAESSGFVESVNASSGERIKKDDLIMQLHNPELTQLYRSLTADIEQTKIRIRVQRNADRIADVANEQSNLAHYQRLLAAAKEELDNLKIRSPSDGVLMATDLASAAGRFIQAGEKLAEVIASDAKEINISLDQDALNAVDLRENSSVAVLFSRNTEQTFAATIAGVDPRVSHHIDNPALAGANGGPIPVRLSSAAADDAGGETGIEFLEPRGSVAGRFSDDASALLFAGELGYARLPGTSISLAKFIIKKIETWVETLLKKAEPV